MTGQGCEEFRKLVNVEVGWMERPLLNPFQFVFDGAAVMLRNEASESSTGKE